MFMREQFLRICTSRKFCFISNYLFSGCCMNAMLWIQVVPLMGCEAGSPLARSPEACVTPTVPSVNAHLLRVVLVLGAERD